MEKIKLKVLYEDNHLIAVFKPAGVLVQGDESGDLSLMDFVKEYLKEKYKKEGNVFLGLLHRLDRPVSGVVLFAKTSKGASRLSEQFRNHKIDKVYRAEITGILKDKKGILKNLIRKDEARGKSDITGINDNKDSSWQEADLSYEVVGEKNGNSIVEIHLGTGRFHQIRSQFSYIGHPIVGDRKYGSEFTFNDGHIELSAVSLKFIKATGDEEVIVKI